MSQREKQSLSRLAWLGFFILIVAGFALRLYHLNRNVFYFYDAGMYLNYGRLALKPHLGNPSEGLHVLLTNIQQWFSTGIQTDRPLWQLMVDARVLWGATEEWWYIRALSLVMGGVTFVLLYHFAKRFFNSRATALLSVIFLAFLPSHVFYSRSGLPEASTAFFFLLGLYCYCFPRTFGLGTFLSGLFFACAFFTNYRLIILPILTLAAELILSRGDKRDFDLKKWGWNTAVFGIPIILLSVVSQSGYFAVTSNWMSRQVGLAQAHFAWANIFTYPYIFCRLESWALGILFLGGAYFVWKKDWLKALPFLLTCLQMAMFSFSSDKAVRYLSIMMPFMAMAAAVSVTAPFESRKGQPLRWLVVAFAILAVGTMSFKSFLLVTNKSSHKQMKAYLTSLDPKAKIVATQPLVLALDFDDIHKVISCPEVKDPAFLKLPMDGFRYLVVGPQAYVSWTASGVSFDGDLGGFVGFFVNRVQPLKSFPHLNKAMLERFVFEHNQNLASSIEFLEKSDEHTGDRRIYDIPEGLELMKTILESRSGRQGR